MSHPSTYRPPPPTDRQILTRTHRYTAISHLFCNISWCLEWLEDRWRQCRCGYSQNQRLSPTVDQGGLLKEPLPIASWHCCSLDWLIWFMSLRKCWLPNALSTSQDAGLGTARDVTVGIWRRRLAQRSGSGNMCKRATSCHFYGAGTKSEGLRRHGTRTQSIAGKISWCLGRSRSKFKIPIHFDSDATIVLNHET